MNNKILSYGSVYTYQDEVLIIPNVSNDLKISLNELTVMKKKIIGVYASFGAESGEGDDKFAGWTEVDENVYMSLYKPN